MYNKCTTKSLDSGEGVRSRHSNSATNKMGMNTSGKQQIDVKEKMRTGGNRCEKANGAASQSHWDLLPRLLQICSVVNLTHVQSPEVLLSCTWKSEAMHPHVIAQKQITKGSPDKDICPGIYPGNPLIFGASELGKCCLPPFYTGDTQISLRYSKDALTEVESNPRLALLELKCLLPIASVHVDITYPWLCNRE